MAVCLHPADGSLSVPCLTGAQFGPADPVNVERAHPAIFVNLPQLDRRSLFRHQAEVKLYRVVAQPGSSCPLQYGALIEMDLDSFVTFCLWLNIIDRVTNMNRAAFHQLYVRHASDVYRFALWLSGNPAEADDITSETFVRAWAGRSKIRTETVKAYLFAIARNLFLQQQRQQKRQVGLEQAETIPAAERPSDIVEQRQGWEDLAQQLQRLPESDRAALILRAQYQMAYAEIARVLNISLSAAKVKVHRARLKLTAIRAAEEATNQ